MKFSVRAFFSLAFSTSSRMRCTVDWSYDDVVRTVRAPVMLTHPLMTSSPSCADCGADSPVSAEVSICEAPDTTMPSRGTRSPGFTTISAPTGTSAGST